MKLTPARKAALLLCVSLIFLLETYAVPVRQSTLPVPVVVFTGAEYYSANGKQWVRYKYEVDNREAYPDALFAPAPALPPCGNNTKASRTWVDIFDSRGKRLYGFCALGSNDGLANLWFALEQDEIPPSWIRIVITDRQTGTKVQSEDVATVE
ncbi:MAG TPA: hypothetical protein VGB17_10570 [Pyrinomonadaceae bacterium]